MMGGIIPKGLELSPFERELGSHIHLKNVMYVLGVKKILIFVVVLEDRGYDVMFNREEAYLKHVTTR